MEYITNFVKAVHVELANKGGNIGVFEVLRKDFRKLVRGRHDEAVIVVGPRYQVLYTSVF